MPCIHIKRRGGAFAVVNSHLGGQRWLMAPLGKWRHPWNSPFPASFWLTRELPWSKAAKIQLTVCPIEVNREADGAKESIRGQQEKCKRSAKAPWWWGDFYLTSDSREISIMNALKIRFYLPPLTIRETTRRQHEPLSCQRDLLKRLIEGLMQWKRRRKVAIVEKSRP